MVNKRWPESQLNSGDYIPHFDKYWKLLVIRRKIAGGLGKLSKLIMKRTVKTVLTGADEDLGLHVQTPSANYTRLIPNSIGRLPNLSKIIAITIADSSLPQGHEAWSCCLSAV